MWAPAYQSSGIRPRADSFFFFITKIPSPFANVNHSAAFNRWRKSFFLPLKTEWSNQAKRIKRRTDEWLALASSTFLVCREPSSCEILVLVSPIATRQPFPLPAPRTRQRVELNVWLHTKEERAKSILLQAWLFVPDHLLSLTFILFVVRWCQASVRAAVTEVMDWKLISTIGYIPPAPSKRVSPFVRVRSMRHSRSDDIVCIDRCRMSNGVFNECKCLYNETRNRFVREKRIVMYSGAWLNELNQFRLQWDSSIKSMWTQIKSTLVKLILGNSFLRIFLKTKSCLNSDCYI